MKTVFFITGTSSGIGETLVKELLQNDQNQVFGFSRSSVSFSHTHYTHQNIDLSVQENLIQFEFPKVKNFNKLVLINNAGLLSPISYIGQQDNQQIMDLLAVNLIAPTILTNIFLNTFSSENDVKIILNMGSGAANFPYDGWSAYCSSKAGLHMYTRILKEEIEKRNQKNTYTFCVLPGVIDTRMQNLIRKQESTDFSHKNKFVKLYKENQLIQPFQIAEKILKIVENPTQYDTIIDLKKYHEL
ncbi:MAG: SDR family NAD(P)-dependent oxidoreductase [Flavobacteriales bacterium]